MKLKQVKVVLDAEQLGACRQTCECEYAIEDVTKRSFPGFAKYTEALIAELNGDPLKFVGMGFAIKEAAWNDAPLYVSPLEDALKFTDLLDDVTVAEEPAARTDVVLSAANPVKKMELMNLTEEDLKKACRMTPEGLFSVYDALTMRDGCSLDSSKRRFLRWSGSGEDRADNARSPETALLVSKHRFGSDPHPTPVAPFREVLRLMAAIPGKGSEIVRNQQAELSTRAMAGDHDLERAIQDRRAALPAAAQEVLMVGLQSSGDAKRMRDEQYELETTSKRPRVKYTGDQLLGIVKGICPDAPPDPTMLLDMWDSAGGSHSEFMALYVKFCEVLFFFRHTIQFIECFCAGANQCSEVRCGPKALGPTERVRDQVARTAVNPRA
jgi:hypothetical protein